MNRVLVGVAGSLGIAVLFSVRVADAVEAAEAVPKSEMASGITSEYPGSARVADPWFTRGTMSVQGGASNWTSSMPIPGMKEDARGEGSGAAMVVDLYGRRLGFHLALAGGVTQNAPAPVEGAEGSRMTAGEMHAAFSAVLWNSDGLFLAVGPGFEGRATALGTTEEGNQALTSWQTVIGGADMRARYFVGPRVYFTGSAFLGAAPIVGRWQSVDAAASDVMHEGDLHDPIVLAGNLSASVRPAEWIAFSGGLSVRDARYRFDGGATGREQCLRPYLGLELLY